MVVLIFAGLPLVSMRGEHVGFELVDKYLVGRLRAASIRWMHLVSAVVFTYMGYLMWVYGVRMVSDNLMTAQLGIARGPFAILMALLLMFTAAVHVAYFCVAKESMQTSHEEAL